MPNWSFQIVHFLHTLALALWVGGGVAISLLMAPTVFRLADDRERAGRLVGAVLARFDRLLYACIVALLVTSLLLIRWGRFSPWYAIEYACILMMSASAIFSSTVVSPRLRRLRADAGRGADRDHEEDFRRLHALSMATMQFNLACGTVALLFN